MTNRPLAMKLVRQNIRAVKARYPELPPPAIASLRSITAALQLAVSDGELALIGGRWYVTHTGLLRVAHRERCRAISAQIVSKHSDPLSSRWVFKAVVYKSGRSRGFVGYGDADPSNVSPNFRGSELRIAETRAVSRALRKAYGIGLCSAEELGWTPKDPESAPKAAPSSGNGNGNGTHPVPRLRDRLCLLIRQHHLDPALVKAYAADFCGTPSLHLADRSRLENFVATLSERAVNDRDALLCQLNSYSLSKEVHS